MRHKQEELFNEQIVIRQDIEASSEVVEVALKEHVAQHQVRLIKLQQNNTRNGAKLGFSLRGGKEATGCSVGVFVSHVDASGQAAQNGLKAGDQLIQVNGLQVSGATYEHVIELIRRTPRSEQIKLLVKFVGLIPFQEKSGDQIKWLDVTTTTPTKDEQLSCATSSSVLSSSPSSSSSSSECESESSASSSSSSSSSSGCGVSEDQSSLAAPKLRDMHVRVPGGQRTSEPFGCGVVKGPDAWPGIFVQHVKRASLAERVGLEPGDQLLRAAHHNLSELHFDAAISLIKRLQAHQDELLLVVRKGAALAHLSAAHCTAGDRQQQTSEATATTTQQERNLCRPLVAPPPPPPPLPPPPVLSMSPEQQEEVSNKQQLDDSTSSELLIKLEQQDNNNNNRYKQQATNSQQQVGAAVHKNHNNQSHKSRGGAAQAEREDRHRAACCRGPLVVAELSSQQDDGDDDVCKQEAAGETIQQQQRRTTTTQNKHYEENEENDRVESKLALVDEPLASKQLEEPLDDDEEETGATHHDEDDDENTITLTRDTMRTQIRDETCTQTLANDGDDDAGEQIRIVRQNCKLHHHQHLRKINNAGEGGHLIRLKTTTNNHLNNNNKLVKAKEAPLKQAERGQQEIVQASNKQQVFELNINNQSTTTAAAQQQQKWSRQIHSSLALPSSAARRTQEVARNGVVCARQNCTIAPIKCNNNKQAKQQQIAALNGKKFLATDKLARARPTLLDVHHHNQHLSLAFNKRNNKPTTTMQRHTSIDSQLNVRSSTTQAMHLLAASQLAQLHHQQQQQQRQQQQVCLGGSCADVRYGAYGRSSSSLCAGTQTLGASACCVPASPARLDCNSCCAQPQHSRAQVHSRHQLFARRQVSTTTNCCCHSLMNVLSPPPAMSMHTSAQTTRQLLARQTLALATRNNNILKRTRSEDKLNLMNINLNYVKISNNLKQTTAAATNNTQQQQHLDNLLMRRNQQQVLATCCTQNNNNNNNKLPLYKYTTSVMISKQQQQQHHRHRCDEDNDNRADHYADRIHLHATRAQPSSRRCLQLLAAKSCCAIERLGGSARPEVVLGGETRRGVRVGATSNESCCSCATCTGAHQHLLLFDALNNSGGATTDSSGYQSASERNKRHANNNNNNNKRQQEQARASVVLSTFVPSTAAAARTSHQAAKQQATCCGAVPSSLDNQRRRLVFGPQRVAVTSSPSSASASSSPNSCYSPALSPVNMIERDMAAARRPCSLSQSLSSSSSLSSSLSLSSCSASATADTTTSGSSTQPVPVSSRTKGGASQNVNTAPRPPQPPPMPTATELGSNDDIMLIGGEPPIQNNTQNDVHVTSKKKQHNIRREVGVAQVQQSSKLCFVDELKMLANKSQQASINTKQEEVMSHTNKQQQQVVDSATLIKVINATNRASRQQARNNITAGATTTTTSKNHHDDNDDNSCTCCATQQVAPKRNFVCKLNNGQQKASVSKLASDEDNKRRQHELLMVEFKTAHSKMFNKLRSKANKNQEQTQATSTGGNDDNDDDDDNTIPSQANKQVIELTSDETSDTCVGLNNMRMSTSGHEKLASVLLARPRTSIA